MNVIDACKVNIVNRESCVKPQQTTIFYRRDMTSEGHKPSTVGQRIADARRRKGLAAGRDLLVPEMAAAVGVTAQTAYHWEADTKTPREDALKKLADFLGVTPAFIRYGIPVEYRTATPDPARDRSLTPEEVANSRDLRARQTPRRHRKNG